MNSMSRTMRGFILGIVAVLVFSVFPVFKAQAAEACTEPAWSSSAVYGGGNIVSHNGHAWKAKWWTQGEVPGTTGQWGVWEDLGACNPGTPPVDPPVDPPGRSASGPTC